MTIEKCYKILDVIETGYNSMVFKVEIPGIGLCAIKRLRRKDDFRRSAHNVLVEFAKEIEIYQRLKGVDGVPQIYDFSRNHDENLLEENYFIMTWEDGKVASSLWGRHYDLGLITPENLGKIYDTLLEMDKRGVIHNDLWANNILFRENGVTIIDFNLGKVVNPLILYEYKHKDYYSNLTCFNRLFVDNFLADVYDQKGLAEFNRFNKHIAECEYDFYKKKSVFMLAHDEPRHADYLLKRAMEVKRKLNNPDALEKEGLERILNFSAEQAFANRNRRNFVPVFKVNMPRVLKIITENPQLLTPKVQKGLLAMAENCPKAIAAMQMAFPPKQR